MWPTPTHEKERRYGRKKWRSAAEIIDWSLPCPSIFDTKDQIKEKYGVSAVRPLADNTLRRVARGVDKFVIKNAKPFIVPVGYGERIGQAPRVHDINDPIPTSVSSGKHYICQAALTMHNNTNANCAPAAEPTFTITTAGQQMFITPTMTAIGQTGGGDRISDIRGPVNTTVSKAESCVVAPTLIQYHQEQTEHVRGQRITDPLMTVDMANRYGLAAPLLTEYFGNAQDGIDVREPMHTVTAKDREGLICAFMSKYYSGGYSGSGNEPSDPLNTVTAQDHNAVAAAHLLKLKGAEYGNVADKPLQTVTAGGFNYGAVRTYIAEWRGGQDMGRWNNVRMMLNRFCDYNIPAGQVLIIEIDGAPYFISDIGLRMLTPRELYAANGFPTDYIIERDYLGNAYTKTKQVARCGNAVPPPFATALVRANMPEYCKDVTIITSMQELEEYVAVRM